MHRLLAAAVLLSSLAWGTAHAAAAPLPAVWGEKYEVVSVKGSQVFAGTSTVGGPGVASESYTEETSSGFSNKVDGQRTWASRIDIPLKGAAATETLAQLSCEARIGLRHFPGGVTLRVNIRPASATTAVVDAKFVYAQATMDARFCSNRSIFNGPLTWRQPVRPFGRVIVPYSTLRRDTVALRLKGSSTGWITQDVAASSASTGSDSYAWNLAVNLRKPLTPVPA